MLLAPLPVCTPFPWTQLLQYLAHRLIPEAERIENNRYVRRVGLSTVDVSYDSSSAQVIVNAEGVVDEASILKSVASLFDLRFDSTPIAQALNEFPLLAPRIARVPGMRPLGAWSAFELCVRTILGQQVTVAAAGTLMRRWVQRCGSITPECVLAADLSGIGMPGKRVESIRTLAHAVNAGRLSFDRPWSELDTVFKSLPGFGPWTREYLSIRLGRQPDAFPASDIGLIRAANAASPAELLRIAESWRPYRAYAATYLWAVPSD